MIWCQGRYCDKSWMASGSISRTVAPLLLSSAHVQKMLVMSGSQHLLADKELALERSFVNTWFLSIFPVKKTSQPRAAHWGTSHGFFNHRLNQIFPPSFYYWLTPKKTTLWWFKLDSQMVHPISKKPFLKCQKTKAVLLWTWPFHFIESRSFAQILSEERPPAVQLRWWEAEVQTTKHHTSVAMFMHT